MKAEPCPFCNSDLKIYINNYSNPEVYMPLCSRNDCIAGEDGLFFQTKEEAISAWNNITILEEGQ